MTNSSSGRVCSQRWKAAKSAEHKSSPRLERPIVLNAKAFIPFHTPVLGSGDMAGIILADTIDYCLIGVVALERFADLRDHGVWLIKRRERHSSADVATAKARATLIDNLIIVPPI
jgi:hypothetical protein